MVNSGHVLGDQARKRAGGGGRGAGQGV